MRTPVFYCCLYDNVQRLQLLMMYQFHVWGQERCIQGFGEENRGKINFEDLGADGRVILKWIFKK